MATFRRPLLLGLPHQHGAVAWLTYQDARGHVVYGGKPLGPPPTSQPL